MRYYLRCRCLRFAIAIYRYPRELALHNTIVIVARSHSIEQYSFLQPVHHLVRYSILHNPLTLSCTLHLSLTPPSSFPIPYRHNRHSLPIPNKPHVPSSTHLPHSHKFHSHLPPSLNLGTTRGKVETKLPRTFLPTHTLTPSQSMHRCPFFRPVSRRT